MDLVAGGQIPAVLADEPLNGADKDHRAKLADRADSDHEAFPSFFEGDSPNLESCW